MLDLKIPEKLEIDYNNVPEQILVAVNWWKSKVTQKNTMNAQAGMADILGTLIADKRPLPNKSQADKFSDALIYILLESINIDDDWFYSLNVDYAPSHWLSMALDYSDVKTQLPWKTNMWISKDKVTVSEGYGSNHQILYPSVEDYNPNKERIVFDRILRPKWYISCPEYVYAKQGEVNSNRFPRGGTFGCKFIWGHDGDCDLPEFETESCNAGCDKELRHCDNLKNQVLVAYHGDWDNARKQYRCCDHGSNLAIGIKPEFEKNPCDKCSKRRKENER